MICSSGREFHFHLYQGIELVNAFYLSQGLFITNFSYDAKSFVCDNQPAHCAC